ncbi:diadenylate cyclase CdaA [Gemmatimonadota bacterium]
MTNFLDNIDFTFTSLVDIILVSIFIYYILYPIKGTRSGRIAFGIVFIILLYYISYRFRLQTMSWLLQNFLGLIGIAIIVIFQADIRKALASFGRNPFLDFLTLREPTGYLGNLQRSVNIMAKRNIGALVVIERELELKNLKESGIRLDAEISSEILLSVFNTRSPLHDGAVIISRGRLICAGLILPLSSRSNIGKTYGTRHRAALGLSEESDAVIVVVSEERGKVSIAVEGKLLQLDTPLELEKRLIALLVP